MPRPGTAAAEEVLEQIARKHGTDVRSMKDRCRLPHIIRAKQEFCRTARWEMGLSPTHIGEILNLNHTTVLVHSDPAMAERKRKTRTRGSANGTKSVVIHRAAGSLQGIL